MCSKGKDYTIICILLFSSKAYILLNWKLYIFFSYFTIHFNYKNDAFLENVVLSLSLRSHNKF